MLSQYLILNMLKVCKYEEIFLWRMKRNFRKGKMADMELAHVCRQCNHTYNNVKHIKQALRDHTHFKGYNKYENYPMKIKLFVQHNFFCFFMFSFLHLWLLALAVLLVNIVSLIINQWYTVYANSWKKSEN